MKRILAGLVIMAALVGPVVAGDAWVSTYSLVGGGVSLTNGQANSVWVPVAVLWSFDVGTTAAVAVERVSQGGTFVLGAHSVSNGTSAVWAPDADYPFAVGDVLRITSSATNGVVQVIRKGG